MIIGGCPQYAPTFQLHNEGDRPVCNVFVTVYLQNSEGKTVHEQTFRPMGYDTLQPGYVWDKMWGEHSSYYPIGQTGMRKAEFIPSKWKSGPNAAYAKITDIEFADK